MEQWSDWKCSIFCYQIIIIGPCMNTDSRVKGISGVVSNSCPVVVRAFKFRIASAGFITSNNSYYIYGLNPCIPDVISKLNLGIDGRGIYCDIALWWIPVDLADDNSTLHGLGDGVVPWCEKQFTGPLATKSMPRYDHKELRVIEIWLAKDIIIRQYYFGVGHAQRRFVRGIWEFTIVINMADLFDSGLSVSKQTICLYIWSWGQMFMYDIHIYSILNSGYILSHGVIENRLWCFIICFGLSSVKLCKG